MRGSVTRDELITFLFQFFGEESIREAERKDREGANGLQVVGEKNVSGVALGVTANLEFFQRAVEAGCNFLIVHHGLRLKEVEFFIPSLLRERLEYLFAHNLTLMGFHYLLDSHYRVGNNAQILKRFGAYLRETFNEGCGVIGEWEEEKTIKEAVTICNSVFEALPIFAFLEGKPKVKRVGVVSGSGKLYPYSKLTSFILEKADLYITGEANEETQAICREGKINYLAYGHYNTEVFGLQALGRVIKKHFPKLKVVFIKIPNRV